MATLEWRDLALEREKPFVSLRDSTTKNRKSAVRTLHPVAVTAIKRIRQRQSKTGDRDFVFEGLLPKPDHMRQDLDRAEIPYDELRRVDFHSLRHTTGTLVVSQPNIAPRTAMEVMRHGSIGLTMNTYTDAALLPTEEAILSLPWFGETPEGEAGKSTHMRTHGSDASGRGVTQTVANGLGDQRAGEPDK